MHQADHDHFQGDQREPHDDGHAASKQNLESLRIQTFHCPKMADVDALAAARGYKNRDEVTISPQAMGDAYEGKVKAFFDEHLHEDEEIRYILEGSGYFDVRDRNDKWLRIMLDQHDLLIMPAGIYHRFTTDSNNVSRNCEAKFPSFYSNAKSSIPKPCGYSKTNRSGRRTIVAQTLIQIHTGPRIWSRETLHL